jgi:type IV pilus assembly protein PilA
MCCIQRLPAFRCRKGFTLIELLVVVLILAILMAVAMPLYLSAVADSQKKTCRANMQTIANAVEAARVKIGVSDYGALIAGGVNSTNIPDLTALPLCPVAGTSAYTLAAGTGGTSSFKVLCATGLAVHGKFEPGVDNN